MPLLCKSASIVRLPLLNSYVVSQPRLCDIQRSTFTHSITALMQHDHRFAKDIADFVHCLTNCTHCIRPCQLLECFVASAVVSIEWNAGRRWWMNSLGKVNWICFDAILMKRLARSGRPVWGNVGHVWIVPTFSIEPRRSAA